MCNPRKYVCHLYQTYVYSTSWDSFIISGETCDNAYDITSLESLKSFRKWEKKNKYLKEN